MSKRYYIEVKGLDGDNGLVQLKGAGVPDGDILVVADDDDLWPPLARAIREATGLAMDEVRGKAKDRRHVMARVIYAHYAHMMGTSAGDIAAHLGMDPSGLRGHMRRFDDRLFGDKEFRSLNSRVSALLASDVEWTPPERPKPARCRKKAKRKGRTANTDKTKT